MTELISLIFKEVLQIHKEKINHPSEKKWAKIRKDD